jgi:hypothetical protein
MSVLAEPVNFDQIRIQPLKKLDPDPVPILEFRKSGFPNLNSAVGGKDHHHF